MGTKDLCRVPQRYNVGALGKVQGPDRVEIVER